MTSSGQTEKDLLALAGEYAAPNQDAWLAIVEDSLRGTPYEKLITKNYDSIALKPLYTRSGSAIEHSNIPGQLAFAGYRASLGKIQENWDVRCFSSHPDPKEANLQILEDLEKGATSVWLKLDSTGKKGTVIKSRKDLELLLNGVLLDLAPVILDPGGPSLPPAAYLMAVLEERGFDPKQFQGNFGADPLSTLATSGKVIVPMDTLLGRMADLAGYVASNYASAKALNISTTVYHSAGCSEAQELGIALATGVEYLRGMTQAGMSIDEACRQISFTLTCDTDISLSIGKLRAARQLWARVTEECAATLPGQMASLHAVTAPRMFSQRDPWINILRGTAACFGAAIGGADAITVLPFESALGLSTEIGRRIARNTQIILQEESGLSLVTDPAGGSWMIESLTNELAKTAWTIFQSIECEGGMAVALETGTVARIIAEKKTERFQNIAMRREQITGVSEFPNIVETRVDVDTPDLVAVVSAADDRASEAAGIVDTLPKHGDGVLMAALVDAAQKNVSATNIGLVLRGSPMEISPLPQHRLAENFEALRDSSDHWLETYGQRPRIFVANIGDIADFTARATFARNMFEAGGFEVILGSGGKKQADIVSEFEESGASVVIVCSTDALYEDIGLKFAQAFKDAGANPLYFAGRPFDAYQGEHKPLIDEFIFTGCNVLEVLKNTQSALGLSQ
ncbi:MAG: methylmalonyl-CoA mutase family protein [Rhodospirillaceae bacterium]